jgi:hypothetical protein
MALAACSAYLLRMIPHRPRAKSVSQAVALDYEIAQEQAAALGRLGRALEAALAALAAYDRRQVERGDASAAACRHAPSRTRLVQDASRALWCLIIQREVVGLRDSRLVMRDYGVPAEVQNRMGIIERVPERSSP